MKCMLEYYTTKHLMIQGKANEFHVAQHETNENVIHTQQAK
jgi:hypothetical protein